MTYADEDTPIFDLSMVKPTIMEKERESPSSQATVPIPILHEPTEFFGRILDRFPTYSRSLVFAYGSGVFRQAGQQVLQCPYVGVLCVQDCLCRSGTT